MNNQTGLTKTIAECHEKEHGQDGQMNELEQIDLKPRLLVFVIKIFVPGGVRHSVVDVHVVCESNSK